MKHPTTSVYVAERHELARYGIVSALSQEEGIEVVGDAADGITAARDLERLRPDVAILAERLPALTGGDLLRMLGKELPTRIMLLARDDDRPAAYRAFADGASAYLSTGTSVKDLREALAAVVGGEPIASSELQHRLLCEIRDANGNHAPALTIREREVVALLADGLRAAQIAPCLHISPATVKKHIAHVHKKLDCANSTSAVAKALREQLIE